MQQKAILTAPGLGRADNPVAPVAEIAASQFPGAGERYCRTGMSTCTWPCLNVSHGSRIHFAQGFDDSMSDLSINPVTFMKISLLDIIYVRCHSFNISTAQGGGGSFQR